MTSQKTAELMERFTKKFPHKIAEVINDIGSTTKNELFAFLLQELQTQRESDLREVLPYLREYESILGSDWGVNPVQAMTLAYRPPETVMRDAADEIERKRETARKLKDLIRALTPLGME